MASGMIVDFNIDPDLVGIAIGKKGARIKQVEKDSGVSSVNVDGKTGTLLFGLLDLLRLIPPPPFLYYHLPTLVTSIIFSSLPLSPH